MAVDEIRDREYDLSARNPSRNEVETYRHPAEITASLLEREREILSIIEELHSMLGDDKE